MIFYRILQYLIKESILC